MTDFYQNGSITTLHNLGERSTADLEQDLMQFSERRPLGLILPSLYSEIDTPALPAIIKELKSVPYLSQIVIGLDRATEEEYRHSLSFFADLPQHHRVLWNDGPRLKALDARLQSAGLAPKELGKGRNVWYCMGYALATGRAEAIALHDCDISDLRAQSARPVDLSRCASHFWLRILQRVLPSGVRQQDQRTGLPAARDADDSSAETNRRGVALFELSR